MEAITKTLIEKPKEKILILNENLKAEEINTKYRYSFKWLQSLMSEEIKPEEKLIIDVTGGTFKHRNFLEYLNLAWNNHYGIVVKPDDFWYIILTQLAFYIKKFPEKHRSLFTTSEEKQEITIINGDPVNMNFTVLIEALRNYVPTDIDTFLPEFSTSNGLSKLAFNAAFADMASPFYSYSMTLCGIPKVKILGDESDYEKLYNQSMKLKNLFSGNDALTGYITSVSKVFSDMLISFKEESIEFWKNIFSIKRCGSGHQDEVSGWIKEFYIGSWPKHLDVEHHPSLVSVVSYKNLDTKKKYKKYVGLFGSRIEDDFLVPEYGYFVNEVKK